MKRVVLASGSPRRRELLAALIDDFDVIPSAVSEVLGDDGFEDAGRLALAKARDVFAMHPDAVVIGSDTVVYDGDRSYEKPLDEADAVDMWHRLRGRAHRVATGLAVVSQAGEWQRTDVSVVELSDLSDSGVAEYVASGRPMDKAGGYAIQDEDVPTVVRLEGCFCSVMGLGLWTLRHLLEASSVPCRAPSDTFVRCNDCPARNHESS